MSEKGKPFLRLVSNREAVEGEKKAIKSKRRKSIQLGLPYEREHSVVFVDVNGVSSEQFYQLVMTLRPRWVVDARPAPRFDILLGSRRYAFKAFEVVGASYVDLFGELGVPTLRSTDVNPNLWSKRLAERIKVSCSPGGPYLFVFDDVALIEACRWEVPSAMKAILKKPIGAVSDGLKLIA